MIEIYSLYYKRIARLFCAYCGLQHWVDLEKDNYNNLYLEFRSTQQSSVKTRLSAAIAARRRTERKEMHVFLDENQARTLVNKIKQELDIGPAKPSSIKPIESFWPEGTITGVEKSFFKEAVVYKDSDNRVDISYVKKGDSYSADLASIVSHGEEVSTGIKTLLLFALNGDIYPFLGRSTEIERPREFLWALEKVADELNDARRNNWE